MRLNEELLNYKRNKYREGKSDDSQSVGNKWSREGKRDENVSSTNGMATVGMLVTLRQHRGYNPYGAPPEDEC
jgi:hypothetical protein